MTESLESEFSQDILKMLETGTSNDVTIILKDGEIKCNKEILIARCPYFATMLSNNKFVEAQTNTVKMMNVEKKSMDIVVRYIFSGKISAPRSIPSTVKLLDLLRSMCLEKAFASLAPELEQKINRLDASFQRREQEERGGTCSVLAVLPMFQELKLDEFYDKYLLVICNNFKVIMSRNCDKTVFKKMSFEFIKDILEYPVGGLPEKSKAFKLWYDFNKNTVDDAVRTEILYFHLEYVNKELEFM